MSSMNTDHVNIEQVTYFMLHVIARNERNHLEIVAMRCCMLEKAKKKKFAPAKSLMPDQKSLTMKILRAHLIIAGLIVWIVTNSHLIL